MRPTIRLRTILLFLSAASLLWGESIAHDAGRHALVRRQLPTGRPTGQTGTASDTNTGTSETATSTTSETETTSETTPTTPQPNTTSTSTTATTEDTTTTSARTTQPPETEAQETESLTTSTGADGQTTVVTVVVTGASNQSAAPSPTSTRKPSTSSGIGTSTIVGLSVAGGIAILGVIAFIVWKFTRKRNSFDDEPIKWPELNMHGENPGYALPTSTRGASSGLDSASEADLPVGGYPPSHYSQGTAADSTAELYAPGADPYAVPPLPHMNPNQPYRDDPNAFGPQPGNYDPYRGPTPQGYSDAASMESRGHGAYAGEVIPMNNMGRRSPGPQMAYEQPPMGGRQSPGPVAAYGAGYGGNGRVSPGPGIAYGGRQSPGPGPAYGGRQSPGPGPAYGGI